MGQRSWDRGNVFNPYDTVRRTFHSKVGTIEASEAQYSARFTSQQSSDTDSLSLPAQQKVFGRAKACYCAVGWKHENEKPGEGRERHLSKEYDFPLPVCSPTRTNSTVSSTDFPLLEVRVEVRKRWGGERAI